MPKKTKSKKKTTRNGGDKNKKKTYTNRSKNCEW